MTWNVSDFQIFHFTFSQVLHYLYVEKVFANVLSSLFCFIDGNEYAQELVGEGLVEEIVGFLV